MFKLILRVVKDWIAEVVCETVAIGGHCGLCGKWIADCLVPTYWRVVVCQGCIDEYERGE